MQTELDSLDKKNISLAKQLLKLRHNLDINRVIGLNVEELKKNPGFGELLGHIQQQALESIAIGFCKIFEYSNRHELDSIPSIVALAPTMEIDDASIRSIVEFGAKYGNISDLKNPQTHVRATFALFKETYSEPLERLRVFRDKQGAHSQSKIRIDSLPSHQEFESLWEFSFDLYKLVSEHFLKVGPALIGTYVGGQLLNLLTKIGVQDPQWDFPKADAPSSED